MGKSEAACPFMDNTTLRRLYLIVSLFFLCSAEIDVAELCEALLVKRLEQLLQILRVQRDIEHIQPYF